MKAHLHLALIQTNLFWENPFQNRQHFEQILNTISSKKEIDLIVLPEMFTTGFTMNTSLAEETSNSSTLAWMKTQARKMEAAIIGSLIVKDENRFFNRLFFVYPSGEYQTYDKRHLFRMADEHEYFSAGKELHIIDYKEWKICPQICYDLRFPVWSRNRLEVGKEGKATSGYDALVYVANFPAARRSAWNILLPARAIENAAYSIGVNRLGTDGKGIPYAGDSAIYDFKGKELVSSSQEGILYGTLSATDLQSYRQKFAVYLDADEFDLKIEGV